MAEILHARVYKPLKEKAKNTCKILLGKGIVTHGSNIRNLFECKIANTTIAKMSENSAQHSMFNQYKLIVDHACMYNIRRMMPGPAGQYIQIQ